MLITGIGYIIEDMGIINAAFGNINGIENNVRIKLNRENKFVHLFGLSLRIKLIPKISADINASYYSNYKDRFYTAIKAGISYTLVNR